MERQSIGVDTFSAENIRNCEKHVLSMQRRLDKAVADNDKEGIRETFDLLTKRSKAVVILATWRITQRNTGKYTAGVDGIAIPKGQSREYQNQIRHRIMAEIDIGKKPDKIRRVYIPNPNGKKRPLGIPTIHDRIVQEILRIALDPIVEYRYNGNSHGFRPKRSCQDAMSQLFLKLAKEDRPRYVLEGDIKGYFDNIKHEHIIETLDKWLVPRWATETIRRILKAGIFHNGEVYDSETGTPQGGVISPLLANVALTTLDDFCNKFGTKKSNPIVRYADDFVIVCRSEPEAKEIKEGIAEHLLNKVGFTLSEEKTKITHIYKGFDFLGFNFRKYPTKMKGGKVKYTLSIRPQKEKVNNLLEDCKEILDSHKTATQQNIILLLTPKLVGWAMYYRHVVATRTFSRIDGKLWDKLYRWAKRRHRNKSKGWIMNKYFQRTSERKSHFVDRETNVKLPTLGKIPIKRFIKVNNNFRVYNRDPETRDYWNKREYVNAFNQIESVKRGRLFTNQRGKCPHCKGMITQEDIQRQETHVHHVIPKSEGGTDSYSNLRLLHTECHREIHAKLI
jgi:RNA-directed DNA polymerase